MKEDAPTLHGYSKILQEMTMKDDLIIKGEQIIIPESLQNNIIQIAHEGHQGVVKTKQWIKDTMWFPGINKRVQEHIECCLPCQAATDLQIKEPIKSSELPGRPWSQLCTDLYGPLTTGEYLLVVQDMYSRYPVVEVIHSTKAGPIIAALDRAFSAFGIPDTSGSDNGPPYNSQEFKAFAKYMGFTHERKTPYAPWANGMAEKFMKTLGKLMQTCELEHKNWRQQLHRMLRAYRATPHSSTGTPPADLMFNGRRYKTRLPGTGNDRMVQKRQVVENDKKAKERMKKYADKKQCKRQCDNRRRVGTVQTREEIKEDNTIQRKAIPGDQS